MRNTINPAGCQDAFIPWGPIQGAVEDVAALLLEASPPGLLPHAWARAPQGQEVKKRQTSTEVPSGQMAATSQFWVLYLMMTLVATGGLMATAQLNPMAVSFNVDKVPITVLWFTLLLLQCVLSH